MTTPLKLAMTVTAQIKSRRTLEALSHLDCGSLLPLCPQQPAAEGLESS